MKKYIFILKSEIMSNLQYATNIIGGFIGYFVHIFIFLNLWKYIYSDSSKLINSYSMSQMIWYVIITEVLWSILGGRKLCKKICNDVKGGNIAYNLNKPYSYIGYSLSSHLGACVVTFLMYFPLGLILGIIFIKSIPNITIISMLFVILTCILATIINTLFILFIGLFSFIIEDAIPFYWLYSKMILLIGVLFPIEYFPKIVQPIIRFSPIYVVSYGPAKLFVDFSYSNLVPIVLSQIVYIFIAYFICSLLYNKGVRKLNVNGG